MTPTASERTPSCANGGERGSPRSPLKIGRVVDGNRAVEMASAYEGGETLQSIGDRYCITRARVHQILRKVGVASLGHRPEHRKQPHELTADEIEAARLYDEGTSPKELLVRFGLTSMQLHGAVRRCGYTVKGVAHWLTRDDDAELTATIAALYRQGLSATEIVEREPRIRFPETVYKYLKKAGVSPRRTMGNIEANIGTVRALAAFGYTKTEIAKSIGASVAGVHLAMKRHGIRPSRGQAHHEARSKEVA